VSDAVGFI